ncbi:MAG: hypothetical protein KDE27_04150, partial [Planctomycetes bacterium]|nr:hypothetical protein [Planctomycetota bacterium]
MRESSRLRVASHGLIVAAAFFPGQIATAQQTLVVGPTGAFATIASAIAAAAPGDTVLVQAGVYSETIDVDKGIRLIGESGAHLEMGLFSFPVRVHDVAAGELLVLSGFSAGGMPNSIDSRIEVTNCAGIVALADLAQGGFERWFVRATGANQLHVTNVALRSADIADGNAVIRGCVFDTEFLEALSTGSGRTALVQCTVHGGSGVFPGPAIVQLGGELAVTRSAVTATGNNPAIVTQAPGTILLDPSAVLTPASGRPAVSGPASVATFEFGSLSASTTGQLLNMTAHGPVGAPFLTLLSLPVAEAASPFGLAWIHPTNWGIAASGTFPSTRLVSSTLPHPARPVMRLVAPGPEVA